MSLTCNSPKPQLPVWKTWADTPPMGWNSYDAYHAAVTESQFKQIVDTLAKKYLPYGYEYAVVDFCWYNPGPEGWNPDNWSTFIERQDWNEDGSYSPVLSMDEYGRFLPAENRFPSATGGKGFKPLADYVHSKGMKFGIHIIRGIPRQAVAQKMPILGTNYTAEDVIHYESRSWTNNTHIVDITKSGAQEYYNSIFNLYAEWGVDYVKADNTMKPIYREGEIEMMHKAIMQCGRPIVLSQSWGPAPLSFAHHLGNTSNLWRVSDDFWDRWIDVRKMFDLIEQWTPFIGKGTWPDADMLPLGTLCLTDFPNYHREGPDRFHTEHESRLTEDEIYSLMTLWCIARSPLMWGGDPLSTPKKYDKYLLNEEVLSVNQNSINNRQVWDRKDIRIWLADIPESEDLYLGFFNLSEETQEVRFDFFWEKLKGKYQVRDLWKHKIVGIYEETFIKELARHGAGLYRFSKIN